MKRLLLLSTIATLIVSGCGSHNKAETSKEGNVASTTVSSTIHITRNDFITKVIDYTKGVDNIKFLGDKPCIVDFYASWCGPCKVVGPILEELAKEYEGKINIYKVNTDEERQLSNDLGIQGIPAFFFFPMDGKPFSSTGIAKTPEETKKMFKEIIEKELLKINK
jgi:thioredoxin